MDGLDVRILRELLHTGSWDPFPTRTESLREIAEHLGVDKETVRRRLARLREEGITVASSAMLNPNLLSLTIFRAWFGFVDERAKEAAALRLATTNAVRVVYDYVGDSLSLVVADPSSHSPEEAIRALGSLPGIRESLGATLVFPPSKVVLGEPDWRIYRSVRADPRKPQAQVSRESGLSTRTVKRRLARLAEERALLLAPNLDPKILVGVASNLVVRCSNAARDRVRAGLVSEAGDSLILEETYREPLLGFSLVTPNVAKAQALHRSAREHAGVAASTLYLLQDVVRNREEFRTPGSSR